MQDTNTSSDSHKHIIKSKNEELSDFTHTLRHDIRNFVAAIEGYAFLLKDEFDPAYLERITKNVTNINELIDRALELTDSGLVVSDPIKINLNDLIKDLSTEIIPDSISVSIETLKPVKGDIAKVRLLIKHLLENAVIHGKPSNIIIKAFENTNLYKIQFINDGEPIPEKKSAKFFGRPQSFKQNHGLGLNLVKKLAEAHYWSILYNPADELTIFELHIPKELVE